MQLKSVRKEFAVVAIERRSVIAAGERGVQVVIIERRSVFAISERRAQVVAVKRQAVSAGARKAHAAVIAQQSGW